jgi:single-strand selective monofunctional uracil DNA glycosylase
MTSPSPLVAVSRTLCETVDSFTFEAPVHTTYNPLRYARRSHELWLNRYGRPPKRWLLLGMNPGPFGMGQTGVPFGDVPAVRDFLGITAPVDVPAHFHPKRPIEGFALKRREGSGKRLWGWAEERWGNADNFLAEFFVHNYCPLFWVDEGGRNLTPDGLRKSEVDQLFAACDDALRSYVAILQPEIVFGVGAFAAARARLVLGPNTRVEQILHPSPASPLANRNWTGEVERVMTECGVSIPQAQ